MPAEISRASCSVVSWKHPTASAPKPSRALLSRFGASGCTVISRYASGPD